MIFTPVANLMHHLLFTRSDIYSVKVDLNVIIVKLNSLNRKLLLKFDIVGYARVIKTRDDLINYTKDLTNLKNPKLMSYV